MAKHRTARTNYMVDLHKQTSFHKSITIITDAELTQSKHNIMSSQIRYMFRPNVVIIRLVIRKFYCELIILLCLTEFIKHLYLKCLTKLQYSITH
jgi:hypothetical protein